MVNGKFELVDYLAHSKTVNSPIQNSSINKKSNMGIPSLIFWAIFILPLVVFLFWLMRQDKRNGKTGMVVLAIIVIGGIVYMYLKTGGH